MAKTPKATIKKAHEIADKLYGKPGIGNRYAVGMATAKRAAAARKKRR